MAARNASFFGWESRPLAKERIADSTARLSPSRMRAPDSTEFLVVALDQAFRRGVCGDGQSRGVEKAVEDGEVGEEPVVEDAVEVELQVGEFDEARTVAKQAEKPAIGDNAVELIREIEIFLNKRMGGHARPS